ncbi:MAG: hypothetical protein JWQ50_4323 [Caballeronia mineralivorans]|jgi:hypothetical protein|nr:hypothetical protein [Caballeronia mineralivorans]MEA3097700.1 hypothetical protein [Caballeronia mineralivorans]
MVRRTMTMVMVSRRRQRTAAPHIVPMDPDAPAFHPGPCVSHRWNGGACCSRQQDDREKSSHTYSTKIWTGLLLANGTIRAINNQHASSSGDSGPRTKTRHPFATSSGSSKPWALL